MLQSGVHTSGALFGDRCSGSFILNGQLPFAILLSKHWWGYGLCWCGVCSPCSHSAVWYRSMVTTAPDRGTSWATFWRSSPRCRMRWSSVYILFFPPLFAVLHCWKQIFQRHCSPWHSLCAPQAEKVDAALHSLLMKLEPQRQHLACLGTWILYHNLRIMIQYLLSGFELELYSMHEYYYIYWWDFTVVFSALSDWYFSQLRHTNPVY